jgi:type I restriction enzyme S subunit
MEKGNNIPNEWLWVQIEDICNKPQYGYTSKASQSGNIKMLRTTDITNGEIDWDKVPYCGVNPKEIDKYRLKDGDIVISRAGSIGVSYLIREPKDAVFASYLIRFNTYINETFLKLFLESPYYWAAISEKKLGIAVVNINATRLKSINLPLPPLPEQHEIVRRIEAMFSELDHAIENLKKAREQLKTYRQAVLKHAFEGKLTEKWREQQTDLEPAEKLLEKIKEEKQKRYEEQLKEWEDAVEKWEADGKPGKKPRKPVKFKDIFPYKVEKKNLILKVKDVSLHLVDCLHSTPEFQSSGKYCIDTTCITDGKIIWEKIRYVSEKSFKHRIQRLKPKLGDILFAREGTVGTTLVLNDDIDICLGQRMMMFRPVSQIIPKYFMYFFQSNELKKQYQPLIGGTTSPHLNISDIKNLAFKVVPIKEQRLIIDEIEKRFSVTDDIEQSINNSLQKAEALRQSILKQAFEGKLTEDWRKKHPELVTGENSAERLLEKINAEKEKVQS